MTDTPSWELAAFIKLARVGAICFLPTTDGQFLLQKNTEPGPYKGKLRPPGGGQDPKDHKDFHKTILRELKEEFNLDPSVARKKLKFLGYEYRRSVPWWGSAVFELRDHGLKPGVYQASNDPDEKVTLVKADLDHEDYNGPQPHKLITEAAKEKGDALKSASANAMTEDPEQQPMQEFVQAAKMSTDGDHQRQLDSIPGNNSFHPQNILTASEKTRYALKHNVNMPLAAKRSDVCDNSPGDGYGKVAMTVGDAKVSTEQTERKIDWSARLKRLRARRGETIDKSASIELVLPSDLEKAAATASAIPDIQPDILSGKSDANLPTADANLTIPTTGPAAIAYALNNIDLEKEEADARAVVKRGLKTKRPLAVKKLGYIQGFKRSGLHPRDLMISKVPVIPPQFRPYSMAGDVFIPGDANELYRDLINMNGVHKDLVGALGEKGAAANKLRIYDATRAVYGFGEPVSPKTRERGISGFLQKLTGSTAKFSTFQRQLISKPQDYVGRGVIGVDPDLGLDEIALPEEMGWKLYAPYIQRRLVRAGHPMESAVKAVRDRTEEARNMMLAEAKERPVMYSRAPAWHRFSTVGAYPKFIPGHTININSFTGTGLGADHDGDQINVHLPSMHEAVQDVKEKLMPSKMLWSIKEPGKVVPVPKQEMILGLASAQQRPARRKHAFPSEAAALAAIKRGDVSMSDEIQIGQP